MRDDYAMLIALKLIEDPKAEILLVAETSLGAKRMLDKVLRFYGMATGMKVLPENVRTKINKGDQK